MPLGLQQPGILRPLPRLPHALNRASIATNVRALTLVADLLDFLWVGEALPTTLARVAFLAIPDVGRTHVVFDVEYASCVVVAAEDVAPVLLRQLVLLEYHPREHNQRT